jgi:ribonuclease HI
MKIAKPFINQNAFDSLIEKCFNEKVSFTVLGDSKLALKPIAKPKLHKRKAKKYKTITIYVVKKLKNGNKKIVAKNRKIPIELKTPTFKPKIHKVWIPKTNRSLLKPYFS